MFGGTYDFLSDPRRGLYSYAALETRLRENPYLPDGVVDRSSPVIRLAPLTEEDLYLLLENLLRGPGWWR